MAFCNDYLRKVRLAEAGSMMATRCPAEELISSFVPLDNAFLGLPGSLVLVMFVHKYSIRPRKQRSRPSPAKALTRMNDIRYRASKIDDVYPSNHAIRASSTH